MTGTAREGRAVPAAVQALVRAPPHRPYAPSLAPLRLMRRSAS
jgi:hypothetical protein